MINAKEVEHNQEVTYYERILNGFIEVNQLALSLIEKWRLGNQEVFNKINANGVADLVTEVDQGIESLAIDVFGQIDPSISIFGEENFNHDYSSTEKHRYLVIDPIDGTKEFVRGSKEWSISLCLIENNEPVVASIYMPDRDMLFTAVKGQGVMFNEVLLNKVEPGEARIAVSPRQIRDSLFSSTVASSGFTPVEVSALTPKICALLIGEVEAAVYFPQEGQSAALWDYAAAVLLIQEIGGKMLSLDGEELPFSGEDVIHKKGWLATRLPGIHIDLLSKLKI